MKKLFCFAALLLACVGAMAQSLKNDLLPDAVGLHLGSQHADSGKDVAGSFGWNNRNVGVFAGWNVGRSSLLGVSLKHQIVAGGYQSSLYERSYYLGLDTHTEALQTRLGSFAFAITVSAVSGYDVYKGEYAGGAVPNGQRVRTRCTPATGCRDVLTEKAIKPAIAPGIDYKPPFASPATPTFRLSYLHDSGGTGSKALHLTSRWEF